MQRIEFASSHVDGDFSAGLLTIAVRSEDDAAQMTTLDEIEFSVPADFHAHNDAVAAALMTLAGRKYAEVTFNFPISDTCARLLRRYYGEIAIGPVDAAALPRVGGRRLAANFSGGIDSVAVWLLLRELCGDEFAVITSEYGGSFAFEARGFGSYTRDVSCRTTLRQRGFHREGRFNFCVPLLFAEYLDLAGIATGHCMAHTPDGLVDYRDARPAFVDGDLVVNAGGVEDVHLLRSVSAAGIAQIVMALGRERIDRAMLASSPPAGSKARLNSMIFRYLHEDAGIPLTPYLAAHPPTSRAMRSFEQALRLFYVFKRAGAEETCRICPEIAKLDLQVLSGLSFDFLTRYNPPILDLLSEPLRSQTRQLFERCGVVAYDEHDWEEIAIVRRQLQAAFPRYVDLAD
jgi:hypothetical protein